MDFASMQYLKNHKVDSLDGLFHLLQAPDSPFPYPYGLIAASGVTVGDERIQTSVINHPKCAICNEDAPIKYTRCNSTTYCTSKCLEMDKVNHDTLCQAFSDFTTQNPRPANHGLICYKLGAILLEDSPSVKFVWLKCELKIKKKNGKNVATHHLDPRYALTPPPPNSISGFTPMDLLTLFQDEKRGIQYDHTTSLWWRDEFMLDGSKQNKYVDNLLQGKRKRCWTGPLLVTSGLATKVSLHQFSLDVTPLDVHRAGQYAMNNRRIAAAYEDEEMETRKEPLENIRWVACLENYTSGKLTFTAENNDKKDFTWDSDDVSTLTKYLGFAASVHKVQTTIGSRMYERKLKIGVNPYRTQFLPLLLAAVNPEPGECWTTPEDPEWSKPALAFIVRKDGKELTPHHLQAFHAYINDIVLPKMRGTTDTPDRSDEEANELFDTLGGHEARKEVIKRYLQPIKFADFFKDFKMRRVASGDLAWAESKSPYEV